MVNAWEALDTVNETGEADVQGEAYDKKIAFDKIFVNCIGTNEGSAMLEALRKRLVDRPVYVRGSTLEETAYRQGMADVVTMIDRCVEDALTPPTKREVN